MRKVNGVVYKKNCGSIIYKCKSISFSLDCTLDPVQTELIGQVARGRTTPHCPPPGKKKAKGQEDQQKRERERAGHCTVHSHSLHCSSAVCSKGSKGHV